MWPVELQQRTGPYALVGGHIRRLEESFHALFREVARVRAGLNGLRELDLLGAGHRQVDEHAELEQLAERDEVQVLGRGRDGAAASVPPVPDPSARQVAAEGLQRADIDIRHAGDRAVALHEIEELGHVRGVARHRLLAASLVAHLLEVHDGELPQAARRLQLSRIDVLAGEQLLPALT